jgi:hypothetical protein
VNDGIVSLIVGLFLLWFPYYCDHCKSVRKPDEVYMRKIIDILGDEYIDMNITDFKVSMEIAIKKARQDILPICSVMLVYVANNYAASTIPKCVLWVSIAIMSLFGRYMLTNAIERYACEDSMKYLYKKTVHNDR